VPHGFGYGGARCFWSHGLPPLEMRLGAEMLERAMAPRFAQAYCTPGAKAKLADCKCFSPFRTVWLLRLLTNSSSKGKRDNSRSGPTPSARDSRREE